ncbi:MAG TPA: ATP-binding protein [Nitrospira sp.]|nr:ATP-binding protein [Nitrospira sp.]
MKDLPRFQVIRGSRRSVPSHLLPGNSASSAVESDARYGASQHRDGDLTVALRSMEERLAAMMEDRRRLTCDLHDGVLQSLYAIGLSIETARRSGDSTRSVDSVVRQLNQLIQEVRGMIRLLESGQVQESDLASELNSLVHTYKDVSPLEITAEIAAGVSAMVTNEEKQEVLMIVREALSNCVRHAKAAHAAISLYAKGSRLRLLIADDGIGFAQEERRVRGYGLANMATRAKKLGGRLMVRSQIGKGTHIVVEFALEPDVSPV